MVGTLKESLGSQQNVEVEVKSIEILGDANPEEVKLTILSPKDIVSKSYGNRPICGFAPTLLVQ